MPLPKLTPGESKVLALLAEGHNAESIANQLGLTVRTVKNRKSAMLHKCGQNNSMSMILMFYRLIQRKRIRWPERKQFENRKIVVQ